MIPGTVIETAAGPALITATDRGISAITFAGSPEYFGGAFYAGDPDAAAGWPAPCSQPRVEELAAWAQLSLAGLDPPEPVPLDLRGTSFQMGVWQALLAIPRGETRSYAQVAAAIGRPGASRAVAGACAANRVALLVPCHRVIRSDGGTSGYRWGSWRKQILLDLEARGEVVA